MVNIRTTRSETYCNNERNENKDKANVRKLLNRPYPRLLADSSDTSYGLNPTPQSPIGSECVDVKGEISHATLNIVIETGDCYPPT